MRRGKVLIGLLLILVGFLLQPDRATARSVLYSEEAGFHHARFERVSIVVEQKAAFRRGMNYWNGRAGWNLFVYGPDPEVRFRFDRHARDSAACYKRDGDFWYDGGSNWPAWKSPYVVCEVSLSRPYQSATTAHELGHVLGLRHQRKGVMGPSTSAQLRRAWKRFDRRLLIAAGYASA